MHTEASLQRLRIFPMLLLVFVLAACSQKQSSQASSADATSPHATIAMRDGTTVTGAVTSSTPSQITLNMDTGGTRTILTKDVTSVQYAETPAPAPAAPSSTTNAITATNRPVEPRNEPAPPATASA